MSSDRQILIRLDGTAYGLFQSLKGFADDRYAVSLPICPKDLKFQSLKGFGSDHRLKSLKDNTTNNCFNP